MKYKKKLIEVALPLEAINVASALEKGNPFLKGHPRNLHQWWARRPHAAARAVIFAQMIDDPSEHPEEFKTVTAQAEERSRLFKIIEQIIKWDNTTDDDLFGLARSEIVKNWVRTCRQNSDSPVSKELFDESKIPVFHDPFAGGGALPLEAQRLGLSSFASDLNPVAVLINKALIEIPPIFSNRLPVNPDSQKKNKLLNKGWTGSLGLAEDVRYYSKWIYEEAKKSMGHFYPSVEITEDMVRDRQDLKKYLGRKLPVSAYLWARTVQSPNPAFANVSVPLASTFILCSKAGKEAYVEPIVSNDGYKFSVRAGKPKDLEAAKRGTKSGSSGSNFLCLMSGVPMPFDYLRAEGKAKRIGTRLMTLVAEGDRERVYLSPTSEMEELSKSPTPNDSPDTDLPAKALGFRVQEYGITKWNDLFNNRQLATLTTFCDLVIEVRKKIQIDAINAGFIDDGKSLEAEGREASAYADSIALFLAMCIDKLADYNNNICTWNPTNQNIGHLFTKQSIPMAWDYAETAALNAGMSIESIADGIARTIEQLPSKNPGFAMQQDCSTLQAKNGPPIFSTDPPYYDNIGYADLSDFFYVWLRRSLRSTFPLLFSTLAVPKVEELIASPSRHGGKDNAEAFFLEGMTKAMHCLAEQAHPAFPTSIYYAFKQTESKSDGTASTGWETFLEAVIKAGFSITGTWPIRTERDARSVGQGNNALASSVVLVCRRIPNNSSTATRREFLTVLKQELPIALTHLQAGNIAPVDLAQAAIGPGMAVFTRYSKVVDADGNSLSVRAALMLINQTLDEALAEQEGDFDADSRWALTWFDQHGFDEGDFGVAEQLSKSKNTSVTGLVEGGILTSRAGKVRLLKPVELSAKWNPETDARLSAWEIVHQLIRALDSSGENAAAQYIKKLGNHGEVARELCYRLFTLCERKKRAGEAMAYNGLVQSWPEITRLASEKLSVATTVTNDMFEQE